MIQITMTDGEMTFFRDGEEVAIASRGLTGRWKAITEEPYFFGVFHNLHEAAGAIIERLSSKGEDESAS